MLSFLGNSFVVIAIALTIIIVHQAFKKLILRKIIFQNQSYTYLLFSALYLLFLF